MTDNLLEMIKTFKQPEKKEEPVVVVEAKEERKEPLIVSCNITDVSVISLNRFFEAYKEKFSPTIKQTKMAVSGIDQEENLILTTPDPKGGTIKDGTERRILHTFKEAHKTPVLDLEPVKFDIYKNGRFRIIHYAGDKIYLKSYGVLTGLIVSHCIQVGDLLISYWRTKLKKKEKAIKTIPVNLSSIESKLLENVDIEAVGLLYPQLQKVDTSNIKTNADMVRWFQAKDTEINDTNHLILIDDIIARITDK